MKSGSSIQAKRKKAKKKPAAVDCGVEAIRLGRIGGNALSESSGVFSIKPWSQFVQVKKSALERWAAVPAKEKAIVRASLDAGSDEFTRRFQEIQTAESRPVSAKEMSLIYAYRRWGHDGVKRWLKLNAEQTRRGGEADDVDHLLISGWYADAGFSLCWLNAPALFEALTVWGLQDSVQTAVQLEKGIGRIRQRVDRLRLARLAKPIADRMNIDSAVVGKRTILVVS